MMSCAGPCPSLLLSLPSLSVGGRLPLCSVLASSLWCPVPAPAPACCFRPLPSRWRHRLPCCSVPRIQCAVLSVALPSCPCDRRCNLVRARAKLGRPDTCRQQPACLYTGLPLGVCLRPIHSPPAPLFACLSDCLHACVTQPLCLVTVNPSSHASAWPSAAPPLCPGPRPRHPSRSLTFPADMA